MVGSPTSEASTTKVLRFQRNLLTLRGYPWPSPSRVESPVKVACVLNTPLVPVSVADSEIQTYRRRGNLQFLLTTLVVRLLPRGKVSAAKYLGRRMLFHPRGIPRTSSGIALAIDQSNIDFCGELIKGHGVWDKHISDICIRFTRPAGVFYDIGANSGYVALEVASHGPSDIQVIAFEPQPQLARTIAISAALNGLDNVCVYSTMVGTSDDDGTLFLAPDSIHASAVARHEGSTAIRCRSTTIDSLVGSGTCPIPSVIKIDVEGAELDVLVGAEMTIRDHRPIVVFEAGEANCERFGYTRDDLIERFKESEGYGLYFIDERAQLIAFKEHPTNRHLNMIAISDR